jgi:hypothetical protein
MTLTVKGQGEPIKLADTLGAQIREDHGEAPDSWEATLHQVVASNVEQSVRLIGIALVSKDLQKRREAWTAPHREWVERVDAERAIYESLPKRDQRGFVAEPEPQIGPEPRPLLIAAECSGDVSEGAISFSVSVRLVED